MIPELSFIRAKVAVLHRRLAAAGALSAALVIAFPAVGQVPESRWPDDVRKCELSAAAGRISVSALCGTLEVPEDRDEPDGRQLELAWAVVEAPTGNPEPDPVFFLAGGPGQSARDTAPIISRYLDDVNNGRDLIFLDQRGTGGSNALDCDFGDETFLTEPDLDEIDALLRDCHESLDADVRHYTTIDAVEDLDALRRHLGYERVNLVGGSYGTRVAQVYLKRFPDVVRSVVIDGVVPMRLALGAEHAVMLDRAIDKLLAACTSGAKCSERFPDLDEAFAELKRTYDESPRTIQVTDPRTGVAEELEFSKAVLGSSLRFLAYSPVTQMMIPYLIHEAAATDSPERLAAQALMTSSQMSEQIAIGLNFAVGCAEDWPYWPDETNSEGTLLGDSFTELYARVCEWWPADPVGPDYHDPFTSRVPVLILSGELDPVTPPVYGDQAAEQFPNSTHIVAEGRGHITLTNSCIASIANRFIAEASVVDLDTECTERIGPEPFFLDLLGPAP
ncbi:MAG: alpha/beta hydrolase [Candidatus Wenzhouxiangella sp. M2_3B_020]